MKLATLSDGTRDGWLVVVSRDLKTAAGAGRAAKTLQGALEAWAEVSGELEALYAALNAGTALGAFAFDANTALAPAIVGLAGPRTSPRALVDVMARLVGAGKDKPGRRPQNWRWGR